MPTVDRSSIVIIGARLTAPHGEDATMERMATTTPHLDDSLARGVLDWYHACARDLPWRRDDAAPWAVLVSEIMLQQTPVNRVLPVYAAWLERWPTPAALAEDRVAEAVRMWGRLGYPRRALRLHQTAVAVVARHGGEIPAELEALLALPGVGTYTARAVAAFAFRQRHAVIDVNVRRVLSRSLDGRDDDRSATSRADLVRLESLLPEDPKTAARASVALMELGALICTARAPRCAACPIHESCAWLSVGSPPLTDGLRRTQSYAGTDRQVRGRIMAVLRERPEPVRQDELDAVWDEPVQRERALASLLADGLVINVTAGVYALPGDV
jgi:A/G-specific adenine glycosylase